MAPLTCNSRSDSFAPSTNKGWGGGKPRLKQHGNSRVPLTIINGRSDGSKGKLKLKSIIV